MGSWPDELTITGRGVNCRLPDPELESPFLRLLTTVRLAIRGRETDAGQDDDYDPGGPSADCDSTGSAYISVVGPCRRIRHSAAHGPYT